MTPDDISLLRKDIEKVTVSIGAVYKEIGQMNTTIAVLTTQMQHATSSCSQIERIKTSENDIRYLVKEVAELNIALTKTLELVQANRLSLAERAMPGLAGGTIVGIVVAIIEILPQLVR